MEWILVVLVAWVVITVLYKVIPYSELSATKPSVALLPKYKIEVTLADDLADADALEERLVSFGFKKYSEKEGKAYFVRGHILGDISIDLVKIKLGFKSLQNNKSEVTLEASWLILFDTGDSWTFLTELSRKLETSAV